MSVQKLSSKQSLQNSNFKNTVEYDQPIKGVGERNRSQSISHWKWAEKTQRNIDVLKSGSLIWKQWNEGFTYQNFSKSKVTHSKTKREKALEKS